MEEWPPKNYDYSAKLKEKKLHQVATEELKRNNPSSAENDFRKVSEIPGYKGVFLDDQVKFLP